VKEVSESANGTIEGNGIWKLEGVVKYFETAQYIYSNCNPENHVHPVIKIHA
jgi:hypothetical protein